MEDGLELMPRNHRTRRRYTWTYIRCAKQWECKETGEVVTDTQLVNVDCYEDLSRIPKSFHVQARMLIAKRQARPGCKHENKIETTMFADAERHYMCPDCRWNTPRPSVPKELPAIDDVLNWVAEQEGVVASWKAEAKVTKRMIDEADALIKEVFK